MRQAATEKDGVQLPIRQWLHLHGWQTHRVEADIHGPKHAADREEVGTPDVIAVKPLVVGSAMYSGLGQMFYIEAKRAGEKPSLAQEMWHASARLRGCIVIVAHNVTELESEMKREGLR